MHIPRRVQRLTVNPSLSRLVTEDQAAVAFDSVHPRVLPHFNMLCDIDIYPDNVDYAMIQVQGLECVPFVQQTANDSKEVFSNVVWDVADVDARSIARRTDSTISMQPELAAVLERLASFYLRVLDREIPIDHPSRNELPYSSLLQIASNSASM